MSNADNKKKTYSDGMRDMAALWGRVCGRQNACEDCPVMAARGTGMTCHQFAQKFPNKFIPILMEMDKGSATYYSEFCARFPECALSLELLASTTCRKTVFEGVTNCNSEITCEECWMQKYEGDITEVETEAPKPTTDSDSEFIDALPEALQ